MSPVPNQEVMEEWKEARAVIGRFDNNLHDLRKYGFSFITALLTADAILTRAVPPFNSSIPGYLKLFVLLVTLGLFVSLRLLDQHYRLFQQAASRRATVLERHMNVDLTDEIAQYYRLSLSRFSWWRIVQVFYLGFLTLTTLLGVAILYDPSDISGGTQEAEVLLLGAAVAAFFILRIGSLSLPTAVDWTVDRKVAPAGSVVRISWMRFGATKKAKNMKRVLYLQWKVIPKGQAKPAKEGRDRIILDLGTNASGDWLWETTSIDQGLYSFKAAADEVDEAQNNDVAAQETPKIIELKEEKFYEFFTIQLEDLKPSNCSGWIFSTTLPRGF